MFTQLRKIYFIVSVFVTSGISAQQTSAIIHYEGAINKKYVDSFLTEIKNQKEMPMVTKQGIVDMYKNATPDAYILNIKNNESYYYYVPSLNSTGGYNAGSTSGRLPYYSNTATDSVIEINPYLGNIAMSPLSWDITSNSKKIGDYVCYQALATEKLYSRKGHYYYRKVVAWFAPEIPLNFGPKYYNGLPGLILQIETSQFSLTATSIELNPKETIDITIPKGDVTTEKESHQLIKRLEEDRKKGG